MEILTDDAIHKIAEKSGIPEGWYRGPYFNLRGEIKEGTPPCLIAFVGFVMEETLRSSDCITKEELMERMEQAKK